MTGLAATARGIARARAGEWTAAGPGTVPPLAFAALALFAAVHWAVLLRDPPLGRVLAVVAVATAGGLALGAAPARVRARGAAALAALRAAVALLTLAVSLVAIGLPARLLAPGRWDDLGEGLDRAFAGLRTVAWPYAGADEWVRLTVLSLIPLALTAAAALAFWPGRRSAGPRSAASLAVLVTLFASAAAERELGADIARGLALLALVGAWLWLPRVRARDARAAAVAVLAVAVLAVPAAARLDGDAPWVEYESWNWWGARQGGGASFDWTHSYGPIGWRRDGSTVLDVRSREPHYWKVQTLDRFDGYRWARSGRFDNLRDVTELPANVEQRWIERIAFTVRGFRSDLLVGAGQILQTFDAGTVYTSADGTARILGDPLEKGDRYSVIAYVPDPSAEQMRRAPAQVPDLVRAYTEVQLPRPGVTALSGSGLEGDAARSAEAPPRTVSFGLAGDADPAAAPPGADPDRWAAEGLRRRRRAESALRASPYARVLRLARRLAEGRATTYDTVRAIERHLREGYDYNERPPSADYPIDAFLFRDRIGYCQQFSAAMALMLRMNGIPARVAAGFAPGVRDDETREFRVRDLDAHSWVEVYFAGIGWVPFDPTPPAAPAELQSSDALDAGAIPSASRGSGGGERGRNPQSTPAAERSTDRGGGGGGRLGPWALPLGLLAAAALAGAGAWLAARRRARRPPRSADAEIDELRRALERLGYELPPRTTLAALERRLATVAGPGAARYARRLRERRYAPGRPGERAAARLDRRALRRALTARLGPLGRVRGYLALPPPLPARPGVPGRRRL